RNIGRGRKQRARRPVPTGEAADGSIGNAVVKAPAGVELLEGEAIGIPLPIIADRGNPLAVPGGVDLGFVDEPRVDEPHMADLVAKAWAQPPGRNGRHCRADEYAIGINQVVIIVEVAAIDTLLVVEAVIKTQNLLSDVKRVGLLKQGIVAGRSVRVRGGD